MTRPKRREASEKEPINVFFESMSWPRADLNSDSGLEWRLRYGSNPPSREDVLRAASYIAAYKSLVWNPDKFRRIVVRELRDFERGRIAARKRKGRK